MSRRPFRRARLVLLTAPLGCLLTAQLGQPALAGSLSQPARAGSLSQPARAGSLWPPALAVPLWRPDPSPTATQDPDPSPAPTADPGPTETPDPNPSPSPSPSETPSETPDPSPTASPAPSHRHHPAPSHRHHPGPRHRHHPGPTASPVPSRSHQPTPSASPAPSRSHRPGPTASPTPSLAPSPAVSRGGHQSSPVTLTIRTVPGLPGIRFTFDGKSLVTGPGGQVSYTGPHDFRQHRLTLSDTRIITPLRQYRFTRWAGERNPDDAFRSTVRGLPMRANYTVTAAFTVLCPVTPRFTDQHGRVLSPQRISRVTLKSSAGRQVNLPAASGSWLACRQPFFRNAALVSHDLTYSVQSVLFAGTNIVYTGVQRFSPRAQATPTLVGYFHKLTITAHDALFGGRTGVRAVLTLPSHSVRRITLGPGHAATLDHLPQGDYQVNVSVGGAVVATDSFRLSRTKTVDLTAVSAPDLAAIGGGLLLTGTVLPLLARTRRRRLLGRLRAGWRRDPKGSPA